jgi:hypothetical protein
MTDNIYRWQIAGNTATQETDSEDTKITDTKKLSKGYLKNLETGQTMQFLFNPTEFDDSRSAHFEELDSPGSGYPDYRYVRGELHSWSIELYLYGKPNVQSSSYMRHLMGVSNSEDVSDKVSQVTKKHRYDSDITKYTDFIKALLPDEERTFSPPPKVKFAFGKFVENCVVTGISEKRTQFDSSLNVIEETIEVSFTKVL